MTGGVDQRKFIHCQQPLCVAISRLISFVGSFPKPGIDHFEDLESPSSLHCHVHCVLLYSSIHSSLVPHRVRCQTSSRCSRRPGVFGICGVLYARDRIMSIRSQVRCRHGLFPDPPTQRSLCGFPPLSVLWIHSCRAACTAQLVE